MTQCCPSEVTSYSSRLDFGVWVETAHRYARCNALWSNLSFYVWLASIFSYGLSIVIIPPVQVNPQPRLLQLSWNFGARWLREYCISSLKRRRWVFEVIIALFICVWFWTVKSNWPRFCRDKNTQSQKSKQLETFTELSLRHKQNKPQDYIEIFDPRFEDFVRLRRLTELSKPEDLTTHDLTFFVVTLFCFS